MSTALWMNIPLMVLAFGLMAGIPLWLVLRRHDWHGKHETPSVPAYMTPRPVPVRVALALGRKLSFGACSQGNRREVLENFRPQTALRFAAQSGWKRTKAGQHGHQTGNVRCRVHGGSLVGFD